MTLVERLRDYLANRITYPTEQGEPEYVRFMREAAARIEELTEERDERQRRVSTLHDDIEQRDARIAALEEALAGLIDAVNWYHGNALGDPYDERRWLVVLDAKDGATTLLPDYRYAAPARTPNTASASENVEEK